MKAIRLLVLLNLGVMPAVGHAQAGDTEYFGVVSPEWVVIPKLVRTGEMWSGLVEQVMYDEPGTWSELTEFYFRDATVGRSSELRSRGVVQLCCDRMGNHIWALATERSPAEQPDYFWGATGYAVSDSIDDVPFIPRSEPLPGRVAELIDSLSTLPESVDKRSEALVWHADLGGTVHALFQAVEMGVDRYVGCFALSGWLTGANLDQVTVISRESDDCERARRLRPWALLRRSGETLMVISVTAWDGGPIEVWRHDGGTTWSVLDLVPRR